MCVFDLESVDIICNCKQVVVCGKGILFIVNIVCTVFSNSNAVKG